MGAEDYCGMDLFTDFTLEDITKATLPEEKGVYIIKITKRGLPPDEIIRQLTTRIAGLRWEMVEAFLTSRIARISNLTGCRSSTSAQQVRAKRAGTRLRGGTGILRAAIRHSIRSFALLSFGWELEYGWKVSDKPKELESS